MASINSLNDIQKINVEKPDFMLGKGLQMPFAASNSGSRKLMFGTQLEHRLPLLRPEVAYIQTGYEMEFGKHSSSYNKIENDVKVIGTVAKFIDNPKHHYYAIVADETNRVLHVYERKEYKHITENYGYLFDNLSPRATSISSITVTSKTILENTLSEKYCFPLIHPNAIECNLCKS